MTEEELCPCACGRSFIPSPEMYAAHRLTPEHEHGMLRWRESAELVPAELQRPVMYDCKCGTQHWGDSIEGRAHWAMGDRGWRAAEPSTPGTPGTEDDPTSVSMSSRA
jgi:hypothetical protein